MSKVLVRTRIPGVFGEWELRASDQGISRLIFPSRFAEFAPEGAYVDLHDEASWAGLSLNEQRAVGFLRQAAEELGEYLAGERLEFAVALDPEPTTEFAQEVHVALRDIPYGVQVSYSDVAQMVDNPRAARAVGTACGLNPIPVIVPCHRVVKADGSHGAYTGGEEFKRALLWLEGA